MQESDWLALMPDMKQMGYRVKFRMCWQPWVANMRNRCTTPFSSSTSTVGDMTFSSDLLLSPPTTTAHMSTSYPMDLNSPPGGYIQPSMSSTGCNQDGVYNNFDPMASAGLASSAFNPPAIQPLPKAVSNNYVSLSFTMFSFSNSYPCSFIILGMERKVMEFLMFLLVSF